MGISSSQLTNNSAFTCCKAVDIFVKRIRPWQRIQLEIHVYTVYSRLEIFEISLKKVFFLFRWLRCSDNISVYLESRSIDTMDPELFGWWLYIWVCLRMGCPQIWCSVITFPFHCCYLTGDFQTSKHHIENILNMISIGYIIYIPYIEYDKYRLYYIYIYYIYIYSIVILWSSRAITMVGSLKIHQVRNALVSRWSHPG